MPLFFYIMMIYDDKKISCTDREIKKNESRRFFSFSQIKNISYPINLFCPLFMQRDEKAVAFRDETAKLGLLF